MTSSEEARSRQRPVKGYMDYVREVTTEETYRWDPDDQSVGSGCL